MQGRRVPHGWRPARTSSQIISLGKSTTRALRHGPERGQNARCGLLGSGELAGAAPPCRRTRRAVRKSGRIAPYRRATGSSFAARSSRHSFAGSVAVAIPRAHLGAVTEKRCTFCARIASSIHNCCALVRLPGFTSAHGATGRAALLACSSQRRASDDCTQRKHGDSRRLA